MVRCGLAFVALCACGRFGFAPPEGVGLDAPGDDAQDAPEIQRDVCDLTLTDDVVALYAFESGATVESTGEHHAMLLGMSSTNPGRCGTGSITFGSNAYLLVANSPEFDLATGSIDMFVRVPDPSVLDTNQTVIARDASGTAGDGHFLIVINPTGEVVLRNQRGGVSYYRCAPPIAADTWIHLAASFGGTDAQGLRLWVDGVEATQPTSTLDALPINCTDPAPAGGIAGNSNTLILGGNNAHGGEADPSPLVDQFLLGGSLDQVRIRSSWHDFAAR